MINQSKRSKDNEEANKHRFIEEHNYSQENSRENEIAEPQILSIKDLYRKKSLLGLRKDTSAIFLVAISIDLNFMKLTWHLKFQCFVCR